MTEPVTTADPTPEQRRGMRDAIVAQCFGCFAYLVFRNGIMLLFLNSLHLSGARVVAYLAVPFAVDAVVRLPAAYFADRHGKKRMGVSGSVMMALGFVVVSLAPSVPGLTPGAATLLGVIIYGAGFGIFVSSWFAMLSPIVPEGYRGRFFGRLRFSWQICGVAFATLCALTLPRDASPVLYQWIMGVIALALAIRVVYYARLPEMERPGRGMGGIAAALRRIVRAERYAAFCAYVFLVSLVAAGGPALFGLIEKRVMGLGDSTVIWLGNALMVGSVVGFGLVGRFIDRYGTRPAFLACHIGFAAALLLFVLRDIAPGGPVAAVAVLSFIYGAAFAAFSVAVSTEMLALIPPTDKSLATSLCAALREGGVGLAGLLSSWLLGSGILSGTWTLGDTPVSAYDSVLLLWGTMAAVLAVTVGLIPKVLRKAQWVPGN